MAELTAYILTSISTVMMGAQQQQLGVMAAAGVCAVVGVWYCGCSSAPDAEKASRKKRRAKRRMDRSACAAAVARLRDAARESALRESVSPRFRADSRAATLEPCRALADLLISKPGSRASMCVEAGGVEAVLQTLEAHPDASEVQLQGLRALTGLAHGEGSAKAFVDGDGVELLIAGLAAHAGDAGVQRWGCQLVVRLAASGAAARALVEGGAVEAAEGALRAHAQPGGDCVVARHACHALCRLDAAGGSRARHEAQAAGALGVARAALAAHAQHETLPQLQHWVRELEKTLG